MSKVVTKINEEIAKAKQDMKTMNLVGLRKRALAWFDRIQEVNGTSDTRLDAVLQKTINSKYTPAIFIITAVTLISVGIIIGAQL